MTTAEFIRYYHGTILGSVNNVYLVHYGDAAEVWCGIGCWVRDTEKDREYASFHSDDIANPFWADLIERLHAHPETITDYIGSGHSPHDIPIPLDETNLPLLLEKIRKENAEWQGLTVFPDFVTVRRTRQIHNDRYAIVTDREPAQFEGGPPLWDQTISKEDAEIYSRNLNEMYAYYLALKAEEDARRRLAAAQREQEMREHPERFSRKPIPKRKLCRMKKRLKYEHPDT